MNTKEERTTKKIVTSVAVLVVLSLGVLGYLASENVPQTENDEKNIGNEQKTKTVYVSTTTTEFISTTTSVTRNVPVQQKPTNTGPAFKSPQLGLTVPGVYDVTATQNIYSGIPSTVSYDFYINGVLAFSINAFSKEQWNDIRIQETRLALAGRFNSYLGEGRYMGENKLWIYSYIPAASTPPMSTRFY